MKNEIVKSFNSADQKLMASFVTGVEKSLQNLSLKLDDYQIVCAKNTFKKAYDLCQSNNVDINIIKDNISTFVERAAMFKLNALAMPAECYMIVRDANKDGKTPYLEFGVEGDGNDRILVEYGRDVEKVFPYWLVRENDTFKYPSFKGIEVCPPEWCPKDYYSKVLRVVYPIKYKDGTVQYHISERESVKNNLLAHINQNLMGEFFGINTYGKKGDAYKVAKKELDAKRKAIIDSVKDKSLEEILDDASVQSYLSPSWRSPHSREAMIVRKMRNNVTKPIPKDFGSAYIYDAYKETFVEETNAAELDPRINKEEALETEVEEHAVSGNVTSEKLEEANQPNETIENVQDAHSNNEDEVPY